MPEPDLKNDPKAAAVPSSPHSPENEPRTTRIFRSVWNENPAEIRLSIVVAVPAPRLFKALSDAQELGKWLCRTARVDLSPDGEFAFGWGQDIQARWKVGAYEKDKALELLRPGPLRFTLTEEADGRTRLEVSATLQSDAENAVGEKTLWSIHLLYLKAYLEHGLDLREADLRKTWRDGYVNGAEPS